MDKYAELLINRIKRDRMLGIETNIPKHGCGNYDLAEIDGHLLRIPLSFDYRDVLLKAPLPEQFWGLPIFKGAEPAFDYANENKPSISKKFLLVDSKGCKEVRDLLNEGYTIKNMAAATTGSQTSMRSVCYIYLEKEM